MLTWKVEIVDLPCMFALRCIANEHEFDCKSLQGLRDAGFISEAKSCSNNNVTYDHKFRLNKIKKKSGMSIRHRIILFAIIS